MASRLYGAPFTGGRGGLGEVSGTHEFFDLVREGDEVRKARLDLAVNVVDVGLLAIIGEQVSQICEVLEPVREGSLNDGVAGERVEDVVVGLGLGEGQRGHQVRAGAEEELDRLLQVPLRETVELRVRFELGVLDRPNVSEERRQGPGRCRRCACRWSSPVRRPRRPAKSERDFAAGPASRRGPYLSI